MLAAAKVLGEAGSGGAGATIFSTQGKFAPPVAALVNGAMGHSMDFDPMNTPASLAPSPSAIPAALAAAEMTGASGKSILTAIVAGYDVTCKLSQALKPADMYERGFHPTAVAGCFGATAAAGNVLGLTVEQMMHAFGIALSEAAGSMQYLRNGAWTKRFQAGNAGRNGLVAATFAKSGFTGAVDPIEGRFGLFHAYVPSADPDKAVANIRKVWEIETTGIKPYPACRLSHAPADLAAAFYDEHGDRSGDIARGNRGPEQYGSRHHRAAGGAEAPSPRAWSMASFPHTSPSQSCCGRVGCVGRLRAATRRQQTLRSDAESEGLPGPACRGEIPCLLSGSLKVSCGMERRTSSSSAFRRETPRTS